MGDPQKHSSPEGLRGPSDDRMMNMIKLKKKKSNVYSALITWHLLIYLNLIPTL